MKLLKFNIYAAVAGFFLAVLTLAVWAQESLTAGPTSPSAVPSVLLPSVALSASPSAMSSASPSEAPTIAGQVMFSGGETVISGGGIVVENSSQSRGKAVITGGATVLTKPHVSEAASTVPPIAPSASSSVGPSLGPSAVPPQTIIKVAETSGNSYNLTSSQIKHRVIY
jgi:hypothetical protein